MGISDATLLPPEKPLFEAGLDSLMAVEFRNVLADVFGHPFPSTLLFDYPSLQKLSAHLQGAEKESTPKSVRIAQDMKLHATSSNSPRYTDETRTKTMPEVFDYPNTDLYVNNLERYF